MTKGWLWQPSRNVIPTEKYFVFVIPTEGPEGPSGGIYEKDSGAATRLHRSLGSLRSLGMTGWGRHTLFGMMACGSHRSLVRDRT